MNKEIVADLVAALELYLRTYADMQKHPTPVQEAEMITVARAALAKAKGEI